MKVSPSCYYLLPNKWKIQACFYVTHILQPSFQLALIFMGKGSKQFWPFQRMIHPKMLFFTWSNKLAGE